MQKGQNSLKCVGWWDKWSRDEVDESIVDLNFSEVRQYSDIIQGGTYSDRQLR